VLNTPFPPWPDFSEEEAAAVARVLRSNRVNYWTGEETRTFEREFACWSGVRHAVALNNGTVALEAAVRAVGIGPGDEVVVTPRSFVASASCALSVGATPVFADVDRDTQNITARTIEAVVGPRTRAVIPVHLGGMPCDMEPILDLARAHGLAVIEDCAQAHGARYKGRMVGSLGDVGAWSFCQDKIMTTGGEGGMVTTDRADLWARMWTYKDHGKRANLTPAPHGSRYRYVHETYGTNGRMLEMQATIGRIQLTRMAEWSAARRRHASALWAAAAAVPGIRVPDVPDWAEHAAYRAYVFVDLAALKSGWDRDRVLDEIVSRGVPAYIGACPELYLEKVFEGTGARPAAPLPIARELGATSLAFLVHPTLEALHIDRTCEALRDVMRAAVR
jgi:dTDP-4-amino-4,6-dideoxygalactose transaminase